MQSKGQLPTSESELFGGLNRPVGSSGRAGVQGNVHDAPASSYPQIGWKATSFAR